MLWSPEKTILAVLRQTKIVSMFTSSMPCSQDSEIIMLPRVTNKEQGLKFIRSVVSKIAQWVKALVINSDDLSLIPGPHVVKGEK